MLSALSSGVPSLGNLAHTQALSDAVAGGQLAVAATVAVFEVVMSLDNALMIGSLVSRLKGYQRTFGLILGLLGACVLRFAALAAVAVIVAYPILSIGGGAYLVYAMAKELGKPRYERLGSHGKDATASGGLWSTVALIIVNDIAFSLDNVVAVVSISHSLIILYLGVLVGMVVMFLVAWLFVPYIEKHPILKDAAYLLMGFAGARVLLASLGLALSTVPTLTAIAAIVWAVLMYEKYATALGPMSRVMDALRQGASDFAWLVDWLLLPLRLSGKVVLRCIQRPIKSLKSRRNTSKLSASTSRSKGEPMIIISALTKCARHIRTRVLLTPAARAAIVDADHSLRIELRSLRGDWGRQICTATRAFPELPVNAVPEFGASQRYVAGRREAYNRFLLAVENALGTPNSHGVVRSAIRQVLDERYFPSTETENCDYEQVSWRSYA